MVAHDIRHGLERSREGGEERRCRKMDLSPGSRQREMLRYLHPATMTCLAFSLSVRSPDEERRLPEPDSLEIAAEREVLFRPDGRSELEVPISPSLFVRETSKSSLFERLLRVNMARDRLEDALSPQAYFKA